MDAFRCKVDSYEHPRSREMCCDIYWTGLLASLDMVPPEVQTLSLHGDSLRGEILCDQRLGRLIKLLADISSARGKIVVGPYPLLKRLSISTADPVKARIEGCPQVWELCLERGAYHVDEITTRAVRSLHFTRWQKVSVVDCGATLQAISMSVQGTLQERLDWMPISPCLEQFDVSHARKVQALPAKLAECTNLQKVHFFKCRSLADIDALRSALHLKSLTMIDCGHLTSLSWLRQCRELEQLTVSGDTKLLDGDLSFTADFPNLRHLWIHKAVAGREVLIDNRTAEEKDWPRALHKRLLESPGGPDGP